MKVNEQLIENVANGSLFAGEETMAIAWRIKEENLLNELKSFAYYYDGDASEKEDVADLLLDFSVFGAEIKVDMSDKMRPIGFLQIFGMTKEETLRKLYERIFDSAETVKRYKNRIFRMRGQKGNYQIDPSMFHYCFAKGRIEADKLLEMLRR